MYTITKWKQLSSDYMLQKIISFVNQTKNIVSGQKVFCWLSIVEKMWLPWRHTLDASLLTGKYQTQNTIFGSSTKSWVEQ